MSVNVDEILAMPWAMLAVKLKQRPSAESMKQEAVFLTSTLCQLVHKNFELEAVRVPPTKPPRGIPCKTGPPKPPRGIRRKSESCQSVFVTPTTKYVRPKGVIPTVGWVFLDPENEYVKHGEGKKHIKKPSLLKMLKGSYSLDYDSKRDSIKV